MSLPCLTVENSPQEDSPEDLKFPAAELQQSEQQPSLRQRYSAMLAAASAPQQQLPDGSCSSSNTHLGSPLSRARQPESPAVSSEGITSSMAPVESAAPSSMERSAAAAARMPDPHAGSSRSPDRSAKQHLGRSSSGGAQSRRAVAHSEKAELLAIKRQLQDREQRLHQKEQLMQVNALLSALANATPQNCRPAKSCALLAPYRAVQALRSIVDCVYSALCCTACRPLLVLRAWMQW